MIAKIATIYKKKTSSNRIFLFRALHLHDIDDYAFGLLLGAKLVLPVAADGTVSKGGMRNRSAVIGNGCN